jgi:hypothetical protein
MAIRRRQKPQQPRIGVSGERARPGPSKAELREQAAAAVASYEGPITRCPLKRRKTSAPGARP